MFALVLQHLNLKQKGETPQTPPWFQSSFYTPSMDLRRCRQGQPPAGGTPASAPGAVQCAGGTGCLSRALERVSSGVEMKNDFCKRVKFADVLVE